MLRIFQVAVVLTIIARYSASKKKKKLYLRDFPKTPARMIASSAMRWLREKSLKNRFVKNSFGFSSLKSKIDVCGTRLRPLFRLKCLLAARGRDFRRVGDNLWEINWNFLRFEDREECHSRF